MFQIWWLSTFVLPLWRSKIKLKKLNVEINLSTTEHEYTESCEYVYRRIYYCQYSTEFKTWFSIKTNTPSESGEISKSKVVVPRSNTLKDVLWRIDRQIWFALPGIPCKSQQLASTSEIEKMSSKTNEESKKIKRLTGISFSAAYTIQEDRSIDRVTEFWATSWTR